MPKFYKTYFDLLPQELIVNFIARLIKNMKFEHAILIKSNCLPINEKGGIFVKYHWFLEKIIKKYNNIFKICRPFADLLNNIKMGRSMVKYNGISSIIEDYHLSFDGTKDKYGLDGLCIFGYETFLCGGNFDEKYNLILLNMHSRTEIIFGILTNTTVIILFKIGEDSSGGLKLHNILNLDYGSKSGRILFESLFPARFLTSAKLFIVDHIRNFIKSKYRDGSIVEEYMKKVVPYVVRVAE